MVWVSHGPLVRVKPHPIPLLGIKVNYSSHFALRIITRRKFRDFSGCVESFTGKNSISSGSMGSGNNKSRVR